MLKRVEYLLLLLSLNRLESINIEYVNVDLKISDMHILHTYKSESYLEQQINS